jgi:hypothetical protein
VLAAGFTAAFFLGLTVKLYVPAFMCGALAVACVLVWMWDTDHGPVRPSVDIGGGLRLPDYVTGPESHSWWATIVLIIVTGTAFACLVFSYLFLWTISPGAWPPPPVPLSPLWIGLLSAGLYAASSLAMLVASRVLARRDASPWAARIDRSRHPAPDWSDRRRVRRAGGFGCAAEPIGLRRDGLRARLVPRASSPLRWRSWGSSRSPALWPGSSIRCAG